MRRLSVFWQRTRAEKFHVGDLAQGKNSPIMFEWAKEFLLQPVELSPLSFKKEPGLKELPREPFSGLNGLFADHVPDGWGRLLIRRGLELTGRGFEVISPLDMLSYIGSKGMGALTFEPALKEGEAWAEGDIDLSTLESGIEDIQEGTPSTVLESFLEGGASPQGMRPKIIARYDGKRFYLGEVAEKGEEWLIKFRAPEDPKYIGALEYVYSLMAKEAGVRILETKLFYSKKKSFFGTKRFDRRGGDRLHMHTLSGLLNAAPSNFSVGYDHLIKVTQVLTGDASEVENAFRLCVFNVLSSNQDDHTRNVSYLMDGDGKWSLSPAYDLTFHRNPSGEQKMGIFGEGKIDEKILQNFGQEIGIRGSKVKSIIADVKSALSKWKRLASDFEIPKKEAEKIGSYFDR